MFSCRETKDAVDTASVRSGLSKGAEAHLSGCSDCRQYADSTFMLMGMLASQPRVEAPADFDFRLRARIARARDENRGWRAALAEFWSRSFSWKEAAAAVAVLVAVASSTTLYVSRDRETQTPLVASSIPRVVSSPGSPVPVQKPDAPPSALITANNVQSDAAERGARSMARVAAMQERSLAGVSRSLELADTQEILVYQPGRAGRPGASRSVAIPRRGQVAFGAQLASAQRPVPSQSAGETF
jgi:hypothetical protein